MNIFATDPCPVKSAHALDDKRLVKMVLESAQMLSTAVREYDPDNPALYKPTHVNHPCNVWIRKDKRNFQWLLTHFLALANEYTHRYGKVHKSLDRLLGTVIRDQSPLPQPANFVNCTPFKDIPDVHEAYRQCLMQKWFTDAREPKWTNRNMPEWVRP